LSYREFVLHAGSRRVIDHITSFDWLRNGGGRRVPPLPARGS
jgi:hypothetical protein